MILKNSVFGNGLSIIKVLIGLAFAFSAQLTFAQEYKPFSRLGTSEAVCKPGIESRAELQSFFANDRQTVEQILQHANWQGNPQDLFDVIAAGDFTENTYAKGTTFEWTSSRKGGKGMSSPNRIWAGEEAFKGFEANVVSGCQVHKIVIPNACCNVSLAMTTEILTPAPTITIESDDENVTICSDTGRQLALTTADGQTQNITLNDSGCWSGAVNPGTISASVTSTDLCGSASSGASHLVTAAPVPVVVAAKEPEPKAAPKLIPFIGVFAGSETRMRYEPAWDIYYKDEASVIGVKAGVMKPLSDSVSLFTQIGYLDRDGVSDRLLFSDDTIFWDVGVDKNIGKSGFIGGGLGYWNIADTDFDDVSLFVHGGTSIGGSNAQWFVEARVFGEELSNIDTDHMLTGGIRYLFK